MILHIPHSSTELPKDFLVSNETDLAQEFQRMTDWYTDELFDLPDALKIIFPFSRLYCDVERFRDDALESMAKKGMGVCYETNSFGKKLRDVSEEEKEHIKSKFYDKHHSLFTDAVNQELEKNAKAIIIDCHSFSNEPLPHEENLARPDFCIGTDAFHTPKNIVESIKDFLEKLGYSVAINEPFAGTIVPLEHYGKNKNVNSIMIEINRNLYLDKKYQKNQHFEGIQTMIQTMLNFIKESYEQV